MKPLFPRELLVDGRGVQRTENLFYEKSYGRDAYAPVFTLKDRDHTVGGTTYLSMYNIYMGCVDEYEAAIILLGSKPHWDKLCRLKWFRDGDLQHRGVLSWREDMRARDESLARKVLLEAAEQGDINAAKKVFDLSQLKNVKGRPKKEFEEAPAIPEHLKKHVVAFSRREKSE